MTREELIGTPFKNYFTDPEPRRRRHPAGSARGQGDQLRADGARQGRARRRSSPTTPRRSATQTGRLQGVFAAARDITEQKKLEQQLREAAGLQPRA